MKHKFNFYYDAIYPFLCRLLGKRYSCCAKIRNCKKCIKKHGWDKEWMDEVEKDEAD